MNNNQAVREMPSFPRKYQPLNMPVTVKLRPVNIKTVREARTEFSAAALKALVGKAWNVMAIFECPLCGGTAKVFASPGNGRRKAQCGGCHIRVVERSRC